MGDSLRGFPLEIDPGQPRAHRKSFYCLVFDLMEELHGGATLPILSSNQH